jgi:hypothetical protein
MTADEWESSTDLRELLAASGLAPGGRRLRLFAAACARRVAAAMPDDTARGLLDMAERRADGSLSEREWFAAVAGAVDPYLGNEAARDGAGGATFGVLMNLYQGVAEHTLKLAGSVVEARAYLAYSGGYPATVGPEEWVLRAAEAEAEALCRLLRCVAGDPLRPMALDPRWRTAAAVGLAAWIYSERAFDRLPILADALEEAGCEDEAVLAHCRRPGEHARGCWVIDAILGRA